MKIKNILLSALFMPLSLFAATNAFDNVLIKNTIQITSGGPAAGRLLTSDANGFGTWTTVMSAGGGDVFTASNNTFLANNTFRSNVIATNGVSGASTNFLSNIRLFQKASDGVYMTLISTNAGAAPGMLSGDPLGTTFTWGTTNGNADITWNQSTALITMMGGNYQILNNGYTSSVAVTITHNGIVNLNSNLVVAGDTTLGDGASRTLTINGTTVTAPNTLNINSSTLWITNGSVAVNTNSVATTAAFTVQANAATQVPLTLRGFTGQTANMLNIVTAANGGLFQIDSGGSIVRITGSASATLSSTALNLINNGGAVNVLNNSAATSSSINIGGGTGIGSKVTLSASGLVVGNFSTNQVNLNGRNFSATTNSTLMGPFLSVQGNLIPGSIAANVTYVTNFALANAVTNGAYMSILPPFFENVNFRYQVGCPSNGFVQVYIHNEDLVSPHTASNGVYGATGIMPSL